MAVKFFGSRILPSIYKCKIMTNLFAFSLLFCSVTTLISEFFIATREISRKIICGFRLLVAPFPIIWWHVSCAAAERKISIAWCDWSEDARC